MRFWIVLGALFVMSSTSPGQDDGNGTQPQDSTHLGIEESGPPDLIDVGNCLVFRERAFWVGKPMLVSGPVVTQMTWSPSGKYALYERWTTQESVFQVQSEVRDGRQSKQEHILSLYALATGRSTEIARYASDARLSLAWLQGSDVAMVVESTTHSEHAEEATATPSRLYMLNADSGSYHELRPWTSPNPETIEVVPSPTAAFAFLKATFPRRPGTRPRTPREPPAPTYELLVMGADGRYSAVRTSPEARQVLAAWSKDGSRGYVHEVVASDSGFRRAWYSLTLRDLRLKETGTPDDVWMAGALGRLLTVRELPETSENGRYAQRVNCLWLETLDPDAKNRMLLAGDADSGEVNSSLDAASYVAQGSLFVRPITEIPRSRYERALTLHRRAEALRRVRQVGLAAIMYGADHEDMYPGARDRVESLLAPYLRDTEIMSGFVYTFAGGPASQIQNPVTTELGYIEFDDGRAVVYADGHAQWVPKPRP